MPHPAMNFKYLDGFFDPLYHYVFLHPTLRTNRKCICHNSCYFHFLILYWFTLFFLWLHILSYLSIYTIVPGTDVFRKWMLN